MNAHRLIQLLAVTILVGAIVIAFGNFSKTSENHFPQKQNPTTTIRPVHDNPGNNDTNLHRIS